MPRKRLRAIPMLPARQRADKVSSLLHEAVQEAVEYHGTGLAGFVLLTWDMRGVNETAIHVEAGDLVRDRLPMYVHDAVLTRIAIETAKEEMAEDADEIEPGC